ncbi:HNH endonuclease [Bradyrhizobium centrosematis]|uniref:HNH endonuclease n=1 Tax=Bradyrhizobium centrosematis TaxID=1300039 RepID=UPI00388D7246
MANLHKPKVYPPVNRCIYCGADASTGELSREHIIPKALSGSVILPKSSCPACSRITSQIEGNILKKILIDYRFFMNFPTYRKVKDRPQPKKVVRLPLVSAPPPGIFSGRQESDQPIELGLGIYTFWKGDIQPVREPIPDQMEFPLWDFFRMIAKIAHGYVVGELGLCNFDAVLPDLILRRDPDSKLQHYIGCATLKEMIEANMHPLDLNEERKTLPLYTVHRYRLLMFQEDPTQVIHAPRIGICVYLQLFPIHHTPVYKVFVGLLKPNALLPPEFQEAVLTLRAQTAQLSAQAASCAPVTFSFKPPWRWPQ